MEVIADGIYDLGHETYFLEGSGTNGAVVEFSDADLEPFGGEIGPIKKVHTGKNSSVEYASWGAKNDLPSRRELLVMDNNIIPELLRTKRDLLLGGGMMLYKETFEKDGDNTYRRITEECPMSNEMKEWLEKNQVEQLQELITKELLLQGQYFPEFRRKLKGDITSIEVFECKYTRAQKMSKEETARRRIPRWMLCGDWDKAQRSNIEFVDNWQPKPKRLQTKFIRRFADRMYGGPYYFSPAYWGGRTWIQVSNNIPIFHLANLTHGYVIRFHVKVPKGYFYKVSKPLGSYAKDSEEWKKIVANAKQAAEAFKRQLNDLLKGAKNAGRALFTTYDIEKIVGKEYPGIQIEPIKADLQDEALLKLFEKSNEANISGHGLLPSISGIESSGKLSSGSDIRNAATFYLAYKSRTTRRQMYGWINFVGKENKWFTGEFEGCQFGSRDMMITTLDDNPTGISDTTTKLS